MEPLPGHKRTIYVVIAVLLLITICLPSGDIAATLRSPVESECPSGSVTDNRTVSGGAGFARMAAITT
jgi:hypothetical protein